MSDSKAVFYSKADGFHEHDQPSILEEWSRGDKDLSEVLRALGYDKTWAYGDTEEVTDSAQAWESTKGTSPRYIVEINDVNHGQLVCVDDVPSMLTLRLQLATAMSTAAVVYDIQQLHAMVTKLFRANHHHDPHGACRECDPLQYKQDVERRRQAEERRHKEAPEQTPKS